MIWVFEAEWALSIIGCLIFVVLYLRDGGGRSPVGRYLIIAWAAVGFEALLFLLNTLHIPVPVWTFAFAFGGITAVVYRQLWLFLRIRGGGKAVGG